MLLSPCYFVVHESCILRSELYKLAARVMFRRQTVFLELRENVDKKTNFNLSFASPREELVPIHTFPAKTICLRTMFPSLIGQN